MDQAKQSLVQSWLTKAQHDLAAARKLASGPDPYLDVAIYHCQQAAEKAIKGFLVFHDQAFEKTHDVRLLIDLAITIDANFLTLLEAGARLTPYSTRFRYPGDILEPDRSEFEQALAAAADLYKFVLSSLPSKTHP